MPRAQAQIKSELHTVGELLGADFGYRVPVHQRDFSWKAEEVGQLWEDLMEAMGESRLEYFLGTVVVTEDRENKTRSVIDGQQRLATLTMMMAAIRSEYWDHGDKDGASDVQRDFLGRRDKRSKTIEPRLTMNRTNEAVFQQFIVDHCDLDELRTAGSGKTLDPSNSLLLKAAVFVREAVQEKIASSKDYESFLLELEEFIKDRVILIVVAVGDEADAYLIFETLNDRGLDLSISDLLKNYIYGRAGPKRLATVQKQWEEMVVLLGDQDARQFLRHYWLSKYGVVRERDLYRELRRKFSSETRVLTLMRELRDAADLYSAITTVDHPVWKGQGTPVRRDLEALQTFGLKQFRPLLLAAIDVLDAKKVGKLVRAVVVISMRYSIIGQLGTGNIEKAYSDAAIAIRGGKAKSAAQIFVILKPVIYPDDDQFRAAFAARSITIAKISRYILAALENRLRPESDLEVVQDEEKVNLEHVMPRSPSGAWSHAAADEAEYLVNVDRIGNMTLIERDANSAAGNASFAQKKKTAFSKSSLEITKQLLDHKTWTVEEIQERQESLAKTAVKIWSLPY